MEAGYFGVAELWLGRVAWLGVGRGWGGREGGRGRLGRVIYLRTLTLLTLVRVPRRSHT